MLERMGDNGSGHSDMLANRVVRRYGGGSQGGWEGAYLCRSHTAESECVSRTSSTTSPTVQQTLAQLARAQVFTKLDANSGFWQIPLAKESTLLTTFIAVFVRFSFNRLPFGITSAPEHFQRRMSEIFQDVERVVYLMDIILVHIESKEELCQ